MRCINAETYGTFAMFFWGGKMNSCIYKGMSCLIFGSGVFLFLSWPGLKWTLLSVDTSHAWRVTNSNLDDFLCLFESVMLAGDVHGLLSCKQSMNMLGFRNPKIIFSSHDGLINSHSQRVRAHHPSTCEIKWRGWCACTLDFTSG